MSTSDFFAFSVILCNNPCNIIFLGTDITGVKLDDAGEVLAETLRHYMSEMQVVDGLQAMGYSTEDIPALVKGTLPQVCM